MRQVHRKRLRNVHDRKHFELLSVQGRWTANKVIRYKLLPHKNFWTHENGNIRYIPWILWKTVLSTAHTNTQKQPRKTIVWPFYRRTHSYVTNKHSCEENKQKFISFSCIQQLLLLRHVFLQTIFSLLLCLTVSYEEIYFHLYTVSIQ